MVKRVGEREIFKTKFFSVKDVDLQLDSGRKVTYQILEKGDTSLIVPITHGNQLIFVREYFVAIDGYQLSLPKGRIEKGHSEVETANKELQEEIGYKAGRIDLLGVLTMSPGYLAQKTHIFLARDLVESKLSGDELEELEVVRYPFDKFEDLIQRGKLTEARTIAALYLARKFLNR